MDNHHCELETGYETFGFKTVVQMKEKDNPQNSLLESITPERCKVGIMDGVGRFRVFLFREVIDDIETGTKDVFAEFDHMALIVAVGMVTM